jgi:dipeptidyl aminopeptidase/acylaminoacyl peptidase
MRSALLLAMLAACSGIDATNATDDIASVTAPAFTSIVPLAPHPGYIVEGVSYLVGGLTIVGQVCRPTAPGRYPILLFNHGGFSGLGAEWDGALCSGAANGFVIAMSSYRGEDDSQGQVEVCAGEVDDTLQMLAIVRAQPYADATSAVMIGASHGGCITLRAVARGVSVLAAADLFGPVHWGAIYDDLSGRLALGATGDLAVTYRDIVERLRAGTGGTPDQVPQAYAARSPLSELAAIVPARPDLLIVHGSDDLIIPVEQSCALAGELGGLVAHHVDSRGQATAQPLGRCSYLTWSAAALPSPDWSGHRHFIAHDGAGHGFGTPLERQMLDEALGFLLSRIR